LKFLIEENDTFEDLVTDSECKLMIAKYEENIEAILEDSKRRHVRVNLYNLNSLISKNQ